MKGSLCVWRKKTVWCKLGTNCDQTRESNILQVLGRLAGQEAEVSIKFVSQDGRAAILRNSVLCSLDNSPCQTLSPIP